MKTKRKKSGITLIETVTVVGIIALLAVFSMPAIRGLMDSQANQVATGALIGSALSSARAVAAKHQRYAGIRFQHEYDANAPNGLGSQYMIFILNEEPRKMGNLTIGYKAVGGIEPIKLPDNFGVMDLIIRTDLVDASNTDYISIAPADMSNSVSITDTTTFSIVFSPSGKLLRHAVRTRNRDGKKESTETQYISSDDIFNTYTKMTREEDPVGMFFQDDYAGLGLGAEQSRNWFVIYDKSLFNSIQDNDKRYDYLYSLEPVYINPYTGTIIKTER
ncbi:MAG: pilus assembly FimT family protein [Planctomycetota bacterium]|jgi:type II secretory pathway pseudopilin PulG